MKSISITFYFVLLYSLTFSQKNSGLSHSQNNNHEISDTFNIFRITKIDSVENIYIILAQKKDLTYKIVSFKDSLNCINKIKTGQCYNLLLKSVFPENYFQKDRISVVRYGSVRVQLGGSKGMVWDLFSIENLKALCGNVAH